MIMTKVELKPPGTKNILPCEREEKYSELHQFLGNTPIDTIDEISPSIFSKLEYANPSGSHYDRAYLLTIKTLEEQGFIRPGDELRDISSGSAGISLAYIGEKLGYDVRITVPSELPDNRVRPMEEYGAMVVKSGFGYVASASDFQSKEIQELRNLPDWSVSRPRERSSRAFMFDNGLKRICYLNHSENYLSPTSFETIAEELAVQLSDISHLVLAEGNWTTIAGISPKIRKLVPGITVVGYRGENTDNHQNFGVTVDNIPLRFKNPNLLDSEYIVSDQQRDEIDERLDRDRKFGRSSLMGLVVAEDIVTNNPGAKVCTIAYDQSDRY